MSGRQPLLKKPKIEIILSDDEKDGNPEEEEDREEVMTPEERIWKEQEEALVALVKHRTKEVHLLRERIAYYQTQLDESEKLLDKTETELAHHRVQGTMMAFKTLRNVKRDVKIETSMSPASMSGDCSQNQSHCTAQIFGIDAIMPRGNGPKVEGDTSRSQVGFKPQLKILSVVPDMRNHIKMKETENEVSSGSDTFTTTLAPTHSNSYAKQKRGAACKISLEQGTLESQPETTKPKHERREHKGLVSLIRSSSSPQKLHFQTGCLVLSQHKRKLRCLVLSPTSEDLFLTSALDGVVNLWQLEGKGSSVNLLSTYECQSTKQRRWPEDIAWHPRRNKCFSVYTADGGDSQISILDLDRGKERMSLTFLKDKPHVKGTINSINFMPWSETCFVTGGSDHDVVRWTEQPMEGSWKPMSLHRSSHSSAVMGVAGTCHKKFVMSAGADKRIVGYDMTAERVDFKHLTESKCLNIQTNPCDFNLFMVQTATPERQLKMFDFRTMERHIHAFGWKQASSESQSALVNQAWSPDGLYISSGSADPAVHIFDIRYNSHKPSQSIQVHQKRVFKAVWHNRFPIMVSISSDLNIGLHTIT